MLESAEYSIGRRYLMSRPSIHQLTFADIELRCQAKLSPMLQGISLFLDAQPELVNLVHQDLVRGLKKPHTGRSGLNAERTLRSFILKRVKNWDYRELSERTADGLALRVFTAFFCDHVPEHDAFYRAFNRLTPSTIQVLNAAVVQAAVDLGLEDGKKLRVDTTVVETDIHFPTDSSLLYDSVRVITRLMARLNRRLPGGCCFTNRTRCARRRMLEIERMTARQRKEKAALPKYRELIRTTKEVVRNARAVVEKARRTTGVDDMDAATIEALREEIEHHCHLAERVIEQTHRRVFLGETVPAGEKLYSIFEPHTDLIKRGKLRKPIEFGHKVFLAESGIGLITEWQVLDGNPPDHQHVTPTLQHHKKTLGRAPKVFATDRGFDSEANVKACKKARVALVCIPQRGGKRTPKREAFEKSAAFKTGQRFRAGVEGRISVLFRGRGMKRCLLEGRERFEVFVGMCMLANNLMIIAQLLTRKLPRRRHAA